MRRNLFSGQQKPLPQHVAIFSLTSDERQGWVHPFHHAAVMSSLVNPRYRVSADTIHCIYPADAARNSAVEIAWKMEEAVGQNVDWIVMFDNDVAPRTDVITVLDTAPPEADIIILPYYVWLPDASMPMVCIGNWRNNQMVTPDNGELKPNVWNEIECGGTGAIFIRRRVFKDGRLKPPYFKIIADEKNGQTTSEDIWFTAMCHNLGFRLFTHTGYVCSHFRTVDLAMVNAGMCNLLSQYYEKIKARCDAAGVEIGTLSEELRPELKC